MRPQTETNYATSFLGSVMQLSSVGLGNACAARARALAFNELEKLEAAVRQDWIDSPLMRLQRTPAQRVVEVPTVLWRLLRTANEIAYRTDGLFDVVAAGTSGRALWTDMDLSTPGYVRPQKRLTLDLSSLINGYAADLAAQSLIEAGCPAGIVDIGGVIRAFGRQEWLGRLPLGPGDSPVPVPLRNEAMANWTEGSAPIWDTQAGQLRSATEWRGHRVLSRAPLAVYAHAAVSLAALSPGRSHRLLSQFGAAAAVLDCDAVTDLAYAS